MPPTRPSPKRTYLAIIALTTIALIPVVMLFDLPFYLPLIAVPIVASVALILYLLLALAFLIFAGVGSLIWMLVWGVLNAIRLRRALPASRRTTWKQLETTVADTPGSLILNSLTLGWANAEVWWTPSNIAAEAAAAGISAEDQPFTVEGFPARHPLTPFCIERYLNPKTGNALIIQIQVNPWSTGGLDRKLKRFQARHPQTQKLLISLPLHQMGESLPPTTPAPASS